MELVAAILVSVALTNLCAASEVNVRDYKQPRFFLQKVDHFDPDNYEHFKQKYFMMDEYYHNQEGAPIFLEIHGESNLTEFGVTFATDMVQKYSGVIFALEHRYYGESLPDRIEHEGPRYLSSEQALADIANFIETKKKLYPHNPWIVCGCSYAGNLATWMRLKYPHLVVGAVAGSAPVLAKADFYEYFEVVGEVLKKRDPLCHQKIVEANQELATLAKTIHGQRKLARMFKIPSYYPVYADRFHFHLSQAVKVGANTQNLRYYEQNNSKVCTSVKRNTYGESTLEILINLVMPKEMYHSQEIITRSDTNIGFRHITGLNAHMWKYQFCHEFGYLQTLSSVIQPFGQWLNINELFNIYCKQWNITLETLEENIRKTNLRYGGKTPNVTNVIFMHGSNDPWHPLGVLSDLSSSARAFIFQGLSHCEFFYGRGHFKVADERVPGWMKMFDEIESIVRSWF